LRDFSFQPGYGFRGVEQLATQFAFTIGDDLAGPHTGIGCDVGYPHGSNELVQAVCFRFSEKLFYRIVFQVPQVKKVCFRKMGARIATGVHIKIRRQIRVHVAAVGLVIGQNLPAFERRRTAGIDDRFGEKREAVLSQKLL